MSHQNLLNITCGGTGTFNPNITMELVSRHTDLDLNGWNWHGLSLNPNITLDFVLKTKNLLPWKWYELSKNPNISMEDISNHPELPWNWNGIPQNPNVTEEFIGILYEFQFHENYSNDIQINFTRCIYK